MLAVVTMIVVIVVETREWKVGLVVVIVVVGICSSSICGECSTKQRSSSIGVVGGALGFVITGGRHSHRTIVANVIMTLRRHFGIATVWRDERVIQVSLVVVVVLVLIHPDKGVGIPVACSIIVVVVMVVVVVIVVVSVFISTRGQRTATTTAFGMNGQPWSASQERLL